MFQPFWIHTQTLNKINGRRRSDPAQVPFLFDIVQKNIRSFYLFLKRKKI